MNLVFRTSTDEQHQKFEFLLNQSEFNADKINCEFRSFSFNCSSEDDANLLETELQKIADENEIDGHFETE